MRFEGRRTDAINRRRTRLGQATRTPQPYRGANFRNRANHHGLTRPRRRRLGARRLAVRQRASRFSARPSPARRSAARSARSSAARSTPRSRPARTSQPARASPTPTIQASTEGAAIPRRLRPHARGGPAHLGDALQGDRRHDEQVGGGKGVPYAVGHADRLHLFDLLRGRPVQPAATKIGRVWADGNLIDLSQFTTRFYPGGETQTRRSADRGNRGRGQHPRLSRALLCRVRGYAARRLRQPHSATAVRGHPRDFRRQSRCAGEPA